MRLGATHPEVRSRYGILIGHRHFTNLDAAIVFFDRMCRAEIEAHAVAVGNWGHCGRSRFVLVRLEEVRLILRVLRRYAPARFADLVMEVGAADFATSAWATADAAE